MNTNNIEQIETILAAVNAAIQQVRDISSCAIFCGVDSNGDPRYLESIEIIADDNSPIGIACIPYQK